MATPRRVTSKSCRTQSGSRATTLVIKSIAASRNLGPRARPSIARYTPPEKRKLHEITAYAGSYKNTGGPEASGTRQRKPPATARHEAGGWSSSPASLGRKIGIPHRNIWRAARGEDPMPQAALQEEDVGDPRCKTAAFRHQVASTASRRDADLTPLRPADTICAGASATCARTRQSPSVVRIRHATPRNPRARIHVSPYTGPVRDPSARDDSHRSIDAEREER